VEVAKTYFHILEFLNVRFMWILLLEDKKRLMKEIWLEGRM
jgi:hypothetical protein